MTIALATRGYLFPFLCAQVVMGQGPAIIGAKEATPEIVGAVPDVVAGPSIKGSIEPGPTISGGVTSGTGPGAVAPPSISGGIKPKIG
jgi:hypothetical protein